MAESALRQVLPSSLDRIRSQEGQMLPAPAMQQQSLRGAAFNTMYDMFGGSSEDPARRAQATRRAEGMLGAGRFAADMTPVVGDALAFGEARDAYRQGNMGQAAILGGLATLGMVPIGGDVASRAIRSRLDRTPDATAPAGSQAARPLNEQVGIERARSMAEQSGVRWDDIKQITSNEEYAQFQRQYGIPSAVSERENVSDVFSKGGAMFFDEQTGRPVAYATSSASRREAAPTVSPGDIGFDPRFDPRAREQERIAGSQFRYTQEPQVEIPEVSIYDLEGQPFILGMADRTAAGRSLTGIDDVTFDMPVDLRGGQDYMFYNPGQVWASDTGPVSAMMNAAQRMSPASMLGGVVENPLFLPFRMAPTGGDYSTMVTDAMLSYARNNMTKKTIRSANKDIKAIFPEFKGIENPESMQQLYAAGGDVRKAVQQLLDIKYRDKGGINIGQARLSATDPAQYSAMDVGLGNVGVIEQQRPRFSASGHPTYEQGIPGYGLGRLREQDISAFDLLPELVQDRGINISNPDPKDIYTLRLGVRSGRITESALRGIEARRALGENR